MSEFTYRIPGGGDWTQHMHETRVPVRGDMVRWCDDLYEVVNVIFQGDARYNPLVELRKLDCPVPPREQP